MASLPPAYADTTIATAPTATGTTGTRTRSAPRALDSSQHGDHHGDDDDAHERGLPDVQRQQDRPRPGRAPTPIAAGRLRPARVRASGGGTACIGTGSSGEPLSSWSVVMAMSVAEPQTSRSSDFLVLEQLVDCADVPAG